eukprot:gene14481-biopygen573
MLRIDHCGLRHDQSAAALYKTKKKNTASLYHGPRRRLSRRCGDSRALRTAVAQGSGADDVGRVCDVASTRFCELAREVL